MNEPLAVGLASWIIQDGNYRDFACGDCRSFALEFYSRKGLERVPPGDRIPRLIDKGGAIYEAMGEVVHIAEEWWVVDVGVLIFRQEKRTLPIEKGDWVSGDIYIGVDPYFYFETLAAKPGAPFLIYDWKVERIEMQIGPLIEVKPEGPLIPGPVIDGKRLLVKSGPVMQRDPTRLGWREIACTDAWSDDGGYGEYLLHCRRLSVRASPVKRWPKGR